MTEKMFTYFYLVEIYFLLVGITKELQRMYSRPFSWYLLSNMNQGK